MRVQSSAAHAVRARSEHLPRASKCGQLADLRLGFPALRESPCTRRAPLSARRLAGPPIPEPPPGPIAVCAARVAHGNGEVLKQREGCIPRLMFTSAGASRPVRGKSRLPDAVTRFKEGTCIVPGAPDQGLRRLSLHPLLLLSLPPSPPLLLLLLPSLLSPTPSPDAKIVQNRLRNHASTLYARGWGSRRRPACWPRPRRRPPMRRPRLRTWRPRPQPPRRCKRPSPPRPAWWAPCARAPRRSRPRSASCTAMSRRRS